MKHPHARREARSLALAVAVAAGVAACGTSPAPAQQGDADAQADAAVDALADGPVSVACPGSIAAWCAAEFAAGPCPTSWNAILVLEPSCTATSPLADDHVSTAPCDGYDVYVETRSDAFYSFYFDATTGVLIAASYAGADGGEARCVGGPEGFVPPTCTLRPLCQPITLDGGQGGGG